MGWTTLRAWIHTWAINSGMFRDAFSSLYVITALFSAASALAVFAGYRLIPFIIGMVTLHIIVVVITQSALRLHVLRASDRQFADSEYRFFAWVVVRNSLLQLFLYLAFAFLRSFGNDVRDSQAALAFGALAIMSGLFAIMGVGRGKI